MARRKLGGGHFAATFRACEDFEEARTAPIRKALDVEVMKPCGVVGKGMIGCCRVPAGGNSSRSWSPNGIVIVSEMIHGESSAVFWNNASCAIRRFRRPFLLHDQDPPPDSEDGERDEPEEHPNGLEAREEGPEKYYAGEKMDVPVAPEADGSV